MPNDLDAFLHSVSACSQCFAGVFPETIPHVPPQTVEGCRSHVVVSTGMRSAGFPGLEQVLLSGALDKVNRTGRRTRLVRFQPGGATTDTLVHEYFEETYLVSGSGIRRPRHAWHPGTRRNRAILRVPKAGHAPWTLHIESRLRDAEIHYFV